MMGFYKEIDRYDLDAMLYKATVTHTYKGTEEIHTYYFLIDDADLGEAAELIERFIAPLLVDDHWYFLDSIERIRDPIYTNLEEFEDDE